MKLTTTQLRRIIKEEVTAAVTEADEGGSSGGGGSAKKMKDLLAQYISGGSERKRYEIEYEMDDLADEVLNDFVFDIDGLFPDEKMARWREVADLLDDDEFEHFWRAAERGEHAMKESRKRKQPIRRR
jgi:hypothetical protein